MKNKTNAVLHSVEIIRRRINLCAKCEQMRVKRCGNEFQTHHSRFRGRVLDDITLGERNNFQILAWHDKLLNGTISWYSSWERGKILSSHQPYTVCVCPSVFMVHFRRSWVYVLTSSLILVLCFMLLSSLWCTLHTFNQVHLSFNATGITIHQIRCSMFATYIS